MPFDLQHCERYAETLAKLRNPADWDQEGVIADIRAECCEPETLALVDWLLAERKPQGDWEPVYPVA